MIAIKAILLPADASECSKKALAYALSFAKQYGARLVALHVIDRRWEEQARHAFAATGQDAIQTIRQVTWRKPGAYCKRSPTRLHRPGSPWRPGS